LKPILTTVSGAELLCLDLVENVLLYRKIGPTVRFVFPSDPFQRRVRVRVFGLTGSVAVSARCDNRFLPVQLLSEGGLTDDPYGPNHVRPDSRFCPLVSDPTRGPHHAVFSVQLSPDRKTIVSVSEVAGLSCSYVKWDDRQLYVIRSSRVGLTPVALFSPLTMTLHNVRRANATEPALVRVPLFWYPTNVQTRGECFNQPVRLQFDTNKRQRLVLRAECSDPNARALSVVEAAITATLRHTVIRTYARLRILKPLELTSIQYLNAFPCNSWRTDDWPNNWVLLLTSGGNPIIKWVKEPRAKNELWSHTHFWKRRLVLFYGASPHGNVSVTVENIRPARQLHGCMLCPVWLDSHFTVENLQPPVVPGLEFEVAYTIGILGGQGLSIAEAAAMAQTLLARGAEADRDYFGTGEEDLP
ncbi:MAG: hypothetical protein ACUVWX_11810, partial [Kiritimatiellia bacterium]